MASPPGWFAKSVTTSPPPKFPASFYHSVNVSCYAAVSSSFPIFWPGALCLHHSSGNIFIGFRRSRNMSQSHLAGFCSQTPSPDPHPLQNGLTPMASAAVCCTYRLFSLSPAPLCGPCAWTEGRGSSGQKDVATALSTHPRCDPCHCLPPPAALGSNPPLAWLPGKSTLLQLTASCSQYT